MAVEKMEMMNLVGPIEQINNIAKEMVLLGNLHIVNALNEIDESNFTLSTSDENVEELVDMCSIRPYEEAVEDKDITKKINRLTNYFSMECTVKNKYLREPYDFFDTIQNMNEIYKEVDPVYKKIIELEEELKRLQDFDSNIKYLKELKINLDQLNDLHFFNYKIGILSKENRLKLKKNYENITAIVLHIGSNDIGEVYLIFSPRALEIETDRILRSLDFKEIEMPKEFSGNPKEVSFKIEEREEKINEKLNHLNEKLNSLKKKYQMNVNEGYSHLKMEEAMKKIKNEMACTNNFFYLSGWVPKGEKDKIQHTLKKYGDEILVMFKESTEVHHYIIPPTKLKNNRFLRPFEGLVKMYGVPSYDELDPTIFLSITYMLLFGAMFGDVGQGAFLFLVGQFFKRKGDKKFIGEILIRLGVSSTLFGFLYGSIFGLEHVIPSLLIRPMEEIDKMLSGSIVIGVILLMISFIYSMVNAIKQKDLKEGIFGRNGLVGFLFYILFLIAILNGFLGTEIIPGKIAYTLMIFFIGMIVVREPLANLILKKRPLYEESLSSYYIESGFDILETLLNMLSNTVSFIRVGAFALNHVGLFIAFQTMAKIINNFTGSILIFIIGNIIVIGLEGLIVFIQGLRLEYYEMFSKYYKGGGIEFIPVKLDFNQ